MVSLKRYLSRTDDELAYRKIISVLLSGIAEHSVCANALELETFRNQMQEIRQKVDLNCQIDQLFVVTGATIQALESYNSRTTRLIRRQDAEMQNIIAMLAQTVLSIGGGSDRATEALQRIREDLEHAVAIEDVEKLRVRLSDCLKHVCAETSRQKCEAAAVLVELKRTVTVAETGSKTNFDLDHVTLLPPAAAAKVAFSEALTTPGRKYVVTMVVDRLQLLNSRFGNAVGDQVLRVLRKYIESVVLREGDQLFRWSGPAFVALLARPDTIDLVRGALKRPLDKKLESEFDVGGRSALISLSLAWSVIGLIPPAANVPLFIDKFVAAQTPRDY